MLPWKQTVEFVLWSNLTAENQTFPIQTGRDIVNLHILNLEYLWNEKRYLKIVNSIFLLIQTSLLSFKMA